MKTLQFLGKNNSPGPQTRQRVFRLDMKSIIQKGEN